MNYPCGIIRDLLPLYIDDVCNEDSKQAVQNHLSECEKCRSYYEAMNSTEGFVEKKRDTSEESKINSLKNVKDRINKKIRNIILCAVTAVLVVIVGFYFMCNVAIKNISLEDISVSAHVYPLAELIDNSVNDAPNSEGVRVNIPEIGVTMLTEDTIEKCRYVTVMSVSSEYFVRTIEMGREGEDNTIYISAFKTTLLNNKAQDYQHHMYSLQLQEINRIIFVESDGTETVLWSK